MGGPVSAPAIDDDVDALLAALDVDVDDEEPQWECCASCDLQLTCEECGNDQAMCSYPVCTECAENGALE